MKNLRVYLLLLVALLLVACGGDAGTAVEPSTSQTTETTTTDEEMAEESMEDDEAMDDAMEDEEMMDDAMDEEMMDDESMDDDEAMTEHEEGMEEMEETMEEMDETAEGMDEEMAMTDAPAWMTIPLTDVRSGETFTLADFAGKTVFVEPMATWCTNCHRQLTNVSQTKAQLGETEDVVFVALSVETNLSDEDLADYTDRNGFLWHFAVATPDMLVSLVESFGQSITNPPSTPHFIIRPDGSTTDLTTGFEGPDEILQNLEAESQG